MRRRFAVPLIAAMAAAPWFWFYPDPPPENLPAQLVSVTPVPQTSDDLGGLSGLEVSPDGSDFFVITDRGHIASGTFTRENETISDLALTAMQPLVDHEARLQEFPLTDAEGLALTASGRLYVSFEHAHRILFYDAWESPAQWPSYTRAWRALSRNKGLEALAIDAGGALYALPEQINSSASEALVYRRVPQEPWQQAFTVPVDAEFLPVGADFGPDGRFYLLERGLYPFGFYSRVRVMDLTDDGPTQIQTIMQSTLGTHGNLEGLAVWQDETGAIRLTMVSDDNFHSFMRGEIVEYVLLPGLATAEN